ncbi:GntR family transcriptional regulator [Youxingia wuxianensis]|uniref:GntR family transcriptional regulator n=1 Tax=Youxingia wuxianensis TaxID=2763678 RepID=A0A926IFP1_9FIRM|nr:GntR family transcriptional regulator [Youxingia wuxianensis]MBC8584024.1 GntR family transcriptional regulator [Youxingia wuxianensis]
MAWDLKNDRPIYTQLVEQIAIGIVSGNYPIGEKLPSVRDLASQAAVNPNTMQRALTELERKGLVHTQRTNGRYITEDNGMIEKVRQELAQEQISEFIQSMTKLGFKKTETVQLINKFMEEEK